MKCPKCGGEIPFYDIKPNCKHCGVNILYYTQDYQLERDAKRAELEGAVARMVIARLKAITVGSPLAIIRMIIMVLAVCALLVPFSSVNFRLSCYEETLSVGILGLIQSFSSGLLELLPEYLKSTLLSEGTLGALIMLIFFVLIVILDLVIFVFFVLGIFKPDRSAKKMKNISVVVCVISVIAQISAFICKAFIVHESPNNTFIIGFGATANLLMHLLFIFVNIKMLKKGVEPAYREFDPKRRELLKKVKKGEVDLDDLTLPIFESEEEYEMRMREFRHAMEDEGDEMPESEAAEEHKEEEATVK